MPCNQFPSTRMSFQCVRLACGLLTGVAVAIRALYQLVYADQERVIRQRCIVVARIMWAWVVLIITSRGCMYTRDLSPHLQHGSLLNYQMFEPNGPGTYRLQL